MEIRDNWFVDSTVPWNFNEYSMELNSMKLCDNWYGEFRVPWSSLDNFVWNQWHLYQQSPAFYGIPWNTSWNSMDFCVIPSSMKFHKFHRILWNFSIGYGVSMEFVDGTKFCGTFKFNRIPWNCVLRVGNIYMDFGVAVKFHATFNGIPCGTSLLT